MPSAHFKTFHHTTETQNGPRDTETSLREVLCASGDFCVSVVSSEVLG